MTVEKLRVLHVKALPAAWPARDNDGGAAIRTYGAHIYTQMVKT